MTTHQTKPKCDESSDESTDTNSDDNSSDETNVAYYNWQRKGKYICKVKITQTFEETVNLLKESIEELKHHILRKRIQNSCCQNMKATLAPDDLLIHVDFSESYKNQQQNEIQSAYFGNTTFSLFTACAYFRYSTDDHASHHCIAIVIESS